MSKVHRKQGIHTCGREVRPRVSGGHGESKLSKLLHKPYLVKWLQRGQNVQKTVQMIYEWPLILIGENVIWEERQSFDI